MCQTLQAFLLFLSSSSLYAMFIGNPAEPAVMDKGIWSKISCISFRIGSQGDWIYKQRFEGKKFVLSDDGILIAEETHTKNQMTTYSGIATLNVVKRVDLYALLGSSKMQIDDILYARREFSWCVGAKTVFLKHKNFFFGADVKYFETDQKPRYFVIDGLPFNVVNDYHSNYYELQAAIGMSYRISLFVPYIHATYIYSHITPSPPLVLVRFPNDVNEFADIEIPTLSSRKNWGMAIGFTLVDLGKASLGFEWRTINQNAVNVNGEIRF